MWQKVTKWTKVLPPSRPSREHIHWFKRHLQTRNREARVGVLGSTPELRDLAGKLKFRRVDVLERDMEVCARMTRLRTGNTKETFVKGDWRKTLGARRGQYTVLLSDLTGGNIPYDERAEFYETIAAALEDDGLFLDKCLTHPGPHERLEELLDKYEWQPVNWETVNWFNCEVFFCSTLLDKCDRVDTTDFYRRLRECSHGETVGRILQMMPYVTPEGMVWYYGRSWDEIKAMYEKHLVATDTLEEKNESPYYGRMKCIAWRRR